MKNEKGERGVQWRTRLAAVVAVVTLAPSLTWSQDRGQVSPIGRTSSVTVTDLLSGSSRCSARAAW
jgi:hypothetical protein